MGQLDGQVALVTGAGSGIGAESLPLAADVADAAAGPEAVRQQGSGTVLDVSSLAGYRAMPRPARRTARRRPA